MKSASKKPDKQHVKKQSEDIRTKSQKNAGQTEKSRPIDRTHHSSEIDPNEP